MEKDGEIFQIPALTEPKLTPAVMKAVNAVSWILKSAQGQHPVAVGTLPGIVIPVVNKIILNFDAYLAMLALLLKPAVLF